MAYLTASGSSVSDSGMEIPVKYELLENMAICLGVRSPEGGEREGGREGVGGRKEVRERGTS